MHEPGVDVVTSELLSPIIIIEAFKNKTLHNSDNLKSKFSNQYIFHTVKELNIEESNWLINRIITWKLKYFVNCCSVLKKAVMESMITV